MFTVVIVDYDLKEYYSHHSFTTIDQAIAFADGMETAWKISHGPSNCWTPFVIDLLHHFNEWVEMGSPGKDHI